MKKQKKKDMFILFVRNMKKEKIGTKLIIGILASVVAFILLGIFELFWIQIVCSGVFLFGICKFISGLVGVVNVIHIIRKKEKYGRIFNEIGQEQFQFDYDLEKNIYSHLCCMCFEGEKTEELDSTLKIETYKEWKRHIEEKYRNYDSDQLTEFSKYLNQRLRGLKPDSDFLKTVFAVMLALVVEGGFDIILDNQIKYGDLNVASVLVIESILSSVVVIPIIFFGIIAVKPIIQNDAEQNFLTDFKEIIDGMIKKEDK